MPDPPDPEESLRKTMDADGEAAAEKFAAMSIRDVVSDGMTTSPPTQQERRVPAPGVEKRALKIPSPSTYVEEAGEPSRAVYSEPEQPSSSSPELLKMAMILEKIQERMSVLESNQARTQALPTFKASSYACGSETESEVMSEIDSVAQPFPSKRQDQPYCPYSLPALSVNGPSEIVDCKTSLIAHHEAITTPGWRD